MTDPLVRLRHDLHRHPDLSGNEGPTARRITAFLHECGPARIVDGLGGHGVAAIFEGPEDGLTVMFRAELDALPIQERGDIFHRSGREGVAHLCGHDGHMAILAGLARNLADDPPRAGRVILLFQPAEETGEGARAVLANPRFTPLRPDWAFALHNMPGLALGHLAVAAGPAACASVGLRLRLNGREAHAAQPETGQSPAPVLQQLLAWVQQFQPGQDGRLATLCHLNMGQPAFGIAPAQAELWITLRTITDPALDAFERELRGLTETLARQYRLDVRISRHDHFNASINDPAAAAIVARAAAKLDMPPGDFTLPMRASEDFGAFSATARTALFFLGAGLDVPSLHNPDYDFPDALIAPAVRLFRTILDECQQV
ncbi:amidohydrolase [Roseinatronobacter alkalisoli]|uniref:Amidohydrolase n=1 Tax=Roseinatronobacter alkalisoli TaxID=3028235 RepID=A0ABT5T2Z0_9RHOB|nr:amidohydrolase [Roseinatronobacter sp. HJB301]MDD7969492.1 amidohydrolase [Roseinatronobacter sp. HJB301]